MHGNSSKPENALLERWSEALATAQFKASHVSLEALINTLAPAAERNFQRLIKHCFVKACWTPALSFMTNMAIAR